jgi:uncharacterized protein
VPWLLRDGEVLASLEIARSRRARITGLLGRDGIEGALLLPATRSVHTVGMRFPLDVAFCSGGPATLVAGDGAGNGEGRTGPPGDGATAELVVVRTVRMPRWRVSAPSLRARVVVEAEAGSFARWELRPGDRLEVKQ